MMSSTFSLILIAVAFGFWIFGLFANRIFGIPKLSQTSGNYRVSENRRAVRRAAFALGIASLWLTFTPFVVGIKGISEPTRDVAFVLDVSRSMDGIDAGEEQSRMDRAKTLIAGIVAKHPQNRYSLAVFAGESYEAIPKTSDSTAYLALLSGISSKYSNAVGTDYLKMGKFLDDRYGSWTYAADSKPETLAVVLTDGGDAEDTPNLASLRSVFQHAKGKLQTLTVTYGSVEGAAVPLWKDFMGWTVYQTDKNGNAVVSKANRETARRIAEATDGSETEEEDASKEFERSLENVTSSNASQNDESEPISPFHFISLLAFVAAFVIPDKIPAWSKKRSLPAS